MHKNKKVSLSDYDKDMQKKILLELKKRERRRKFFMLCCLFLAVGCFLYIAIYFLQQNQSIQNNEYLAQLKAKQEELLNEEATEMTLPDEGIQEKEVLDEYKVLYNKNKKLIGWIKIDDTIIDYPVMQTVDNEYYLDHNINQEYDRNGSIFLDKDCDILNRNTNLIIYGHHMRSGAMFGNLFKYSDEEYYKEHKYIYFDTIYEKGVYEVMFVFRSRIYSEDEIVFKYYQFIDALSETEYDSNIEAMKELSLYDTGVTSEYGDDLLTLSTCDNYTDNGRFVVVAKRIQ